MDTIRGMIPKTRLGRAQISKLKVYAGPTHPHAAQNPQPLEFAHAAHRPRA
jgi:large subunit ribosomal protein L13